MDYNTKGHRGNCELVSNTPILLQYPGRHVGFDLYGLHFEKKPMRRAALTRLNQLTIARNVYQERRLAALNSSERL